jgi:CO dehydrogenase maturation factor
MAHVIAVAGKGGVGKTTLCGMLIQYLCEKKKGPVLAVDADANSNLNEVLGVEVDTTLGDVREEIAHAEMTESDSKRNVQGRLCRGTFRGCSC